MDRWAAIESDFLQYYRLDPTDLMWSVFLRRLLTLPAGSRFAALAADLTADDGTPGWLAEYNRTQGRDQARVRQVSLAEFARTAGGAYRRRGG